MTLSGGGKRILRSRSKVLALVAVLTIPLAVVSPVAASEETAAQCTFQAKVRHRPGYLLATPLEGRFFFESPGTITCVGKAEGRVLAPSTGAITSHGRYKGTCFVASGNGLIQLTLPTADGGTINLTGRFDWTRAGLTLEGQGEMHRSAFWLLLGATPDLDYPEEDCVNSPLDHTIVVGNIILGVP